MRIGLVVLSLFFNCFSYAQSDLSFLEGGFAEFPLNFDQSKLQLDKNAGYLSLRKSETSSNLFIQWVDADGNIASKWEADLGRDAFPVAAHTKDKELRVFYVRQNLEMRSCELAYIKMVNGEITEDEILDIDSIDPWYENEIKGATLQTMDKAVEASKSFGSYLQADFKWHIESSPSGNNFLAYRYEYSRKFLYARMFWLDETLNVVRQKTLKMDNGRVICGLYINDWQEIYQLNTDALGLMELIRFDSTLNDFDLLELSPSHAMRDDFILRFWKNDVVFVGAKVDYEGELEGLLYAKFDFPREEIERIHFFSIDEEIKEEADSIEIDFRKKPVDWDHFHLVSMDIYNDEEILMGVQVFEIESNGSKYEPWAIDRPIQVAPTKASVRTGTIGYFSFNIYDELRWKVWIPVSQQINVGDYFSGSRSKAFVNGEESISLLYSGKSFDSGLQKLSLDYTYGLDPKNEVIATKSGKQEYLPGWSRSMGDSFLIPMKMDNGSAIIRAK